MNAILYINKTGCQWRMLPKRWIVEKSFSWLENFRRFTIDYEYLAETAESMASLRSSKSCLTNIFE